MAVKLSEPFHNALFVLCFQLTQAHSQLSQYFQRYQSRLRAKNLLYIKQLMFVLQGFLRCLGGEATCTVQC